MHILVFFQSKTKINVTIAFLKWDSTCLWFGSSFLGLYLFPIWLCFPIIKWTGLLVSQINQTAPQRNSMSRSPHTSDQICWRIDYQLAGWIVKDIRFDTFGFFEIRFDFRSYSLPYNGVFTNTNTKIIRARQSSLELSEFLLSSQTRLNWTSKSKGDIDIRLWLKKDQNVNFMTWDLEDAERLPRPPTYRKISSVRWKLPIRN